MKISKLFAIALLNIIFFPSCLDDDDVTNPAALGAFENGFFVLNEGTFAKGTVTYVSNDLNTIQQDIYPTVNPGDGIGGFVQSIFYNGDNAYIISYGSNIITVVNRYTFKRITKIETGLAVPRYGVVVNGKAYITNANTYTNFDGSNPAGNTDDYLAVINLSTNTLEAPIALNATADRIAAHNGKLYIIEPYNNANILVVNTATNFLETPIAIGDSANSMEVLNGSLYVARAPYGESSEIIKVNLTDKTFTSIDLPSAQSEAKNLDIYNNKIYYTSGTSVFAMDVTATVAPTTSILTYDSTSIYGQMYGFAVNNDKIFIADGGDFAANSNAYVYSLTGTPLKTIEVGVGPNGFYFN